MKWQLPAATVVAVLVVTHWATGVQEAWAEGMTGFDTLWYHAPFAARFAESGSIWAYHFTDPAYLNWFYPQNSELVHSTGILLFDRDLLSPLINLGWLAIALLASWCIGRPFGAALAALVGAAAILDTGTMVPREAGTAANDIPSIALFLASAALLLNAWAANREGGGPSDGAWRRSRVSSGGWAPALPAVGVAGLAAGLALGTKLTVAVGVAALTIGVIVIAGEGRRLRTGGVWVASVAAPSAIWFIRNVVKTGNPLPWITDIGPITLPGPERGLQGREPFSVSDYLFPPDTTVGSSYLIPGLDEVLGRAWPAILVLGVLGLVLAIWRGQTPAIRVVGAAGLAAGIAYLFTPLTASGPEGSPDGFQINLRYAVPALALGLALLPLDRALAAPRRLLGLTAVFGLILLLVTTLSASSDAWSDVFAFVPGALAIGLALAAVPVGLAVVARRSRTLAAAGAVALLAVGVGALWSEQDDYFDDRYRGDARFHLPAAFEWAKETSGERIAVGGTVGAYHQYGLYGDRLDNHVQYVGRESDEGDFVAIGSCEEWRTAVNEGDYDYLITTPALDLNHPEVAEPSPEAGWTRGDPAAVEALAEAQLTIFRLEGELDPAGCR